MAAGAWVFLLLSIGGFSPTDWPSHAVSPWPPTGNWCGPVGAFVAYQVFAVVGQGAFPALFFAGVAVILFVANRRVSDPWMRVVGAILFTVAYAATVHHLHPGDENGFPEGQGGVLGIGAESYLEAHVHAVGTRLALLLALVVGLLLAADDLVAKVPAVVAAAVDRARQARPAAGPSPVASLFNRFAPTPATAGVGPVPRMVKPDEDPAEARPSILLKLRDRFARRDQVVLTYDNDAPARRPCRPTSTRPTPARPPRRSCRPRPRPRPRRRRRR